MRALYPLIALLSLSSAVLSAVLFVFPVLTWYGSQWLPGFLIALTGSAVGAMFLFPDRRRSALRALSFYAAPVVLIPYLFLLTPFAYLLGT